MTKLFRRLRKQIWRLIPQGKEVILNTAKGTTTSITRIGGKKCIKKTFDNADAGLAAFDHEISIDELFLGYDWKPPIIRKEDFWFARPFYSDKYRLDAAAPSLPYSTRTEIAGEAISVIFDIFCAGYAHCNMHAGNLYRVNGLLKLTDFERLCAYPEAERIPFPLSYDITGENLNTANSGNMYYTSQGPLSLQNVLGVPAETALKEFEKKLRNRLRDACLTFATATKRHVCRAERIYASFKLPYLSVRPEEAQRNSKIRLENFGIREETLQRKRILDLGSNIGGMLFEIQKYKPAECIGVEYDADKVSLATQIARYNGLENVEFLQADIDCLNPESFGKPFDVVFCLAVESHVNKPMKLFRLLSQLTRGVLYFEGNSNSDTQNIVRLLSQQGFVEVEPLGFGTDDCIPRNNRRPMFRAKKL